MLFAFILTLFFVLDILIFHQFLLFGMMPLSLLLLAVGGFTSFMLLKHRQSLPDLKSWGIIYWIPGCLIVYLVSRAGTAFLLLFQNAFSQKIAGYLLFRQQGADLLLTGFILLVLLLRFRFNNAVFTWLFVSIAGIFMHDLIFHFAAPYPPLLYRYGGFLYLPTFFSWLMVLHRILGIKYSISKEMTDEMASFYQKDAASIL